MTTIITIWLLVVLAVALLWPRVFPTEGTTMRRRRYLVLAYATLGASALLFLILIY